MRNNNNALSFILLFTFGVRVRSDESSMHRVTRSICGEDALLRCGDTSKPVQVQYRSVIWYKVSEAPSHQLTGLVMKRLTHHNSTLQKYKGVERDLKLLADSQSLVLPNVTLQDAGRYRCFLSAPLGHQNQERDVHLQVYEGPIENDGTSRDTIYELAAITLLIASLLMLYVSYMCLQKQATKISYKNKFSEEASKKNHQMKDSIIKMESKGIVCTVLPKAYV